MSKYVPTLGTNGWANDPELVADYILSCFLTTNKSQSNLMRDNNDSLQSILAEFTDDVAGLENYLHDVLDAKLKRSFDVGSYAEVTVTRLPDKPDQFEINFLGNVVSGDRNFVIGKLVKTDNSKVIEINEINING